MQVAMTIAGSDSGGGAGIQADLKTFAVLGVHGVSALTALTAQNTREVAGAMPVPGEFVRAQIDAVVADFAVAGVKTGMLPNTDVIEQVARAARDHQLRPLVVDPVMIATSGDRLIDPDAVDALVRELLPLAALLTPNLPEAEALVGGTIVTDDDVRAAARALRDLGPGAVLIKGGHRQTSRVVDVLLDEDGFQEYVAGRVPTQHTHGSGCVYAAAIAAQLSKGLVLRDAVGRAKVFITEAVRVGTPVGHGFRPVNPLHPWWPEGGAKA